MITNDDILKLQSELTKEQWDKLVYYLSKNRLLELKELIRNKVKVRFVRNMRKYSNKYILKLGHDKNIRIETVNLLKQSRITLKRVYELVEKNDIVDANTLLRSSFENLIMAMMINEDEKVYQEFIDLSIDDSSRNYTKPQKLRNSFRKIMKKLDGNLFVDISNKKLKDMLDEFYDKLCMFTHSTLIVNTMVEIEKDNILDVYMLFVKQNAYFVELLIYLSLKYLTKSGDKHLDLSLAVLGWWILLLDIPKDSISSSSIEKLYGLLYANSNKTYFESLNKDIQSLNGEIEQLKTEIYNDPIYVIKILEKIFK